MEDAPRPYKRQKRRGVACERCHTHKIKCSGDQPCGSCKNAKVGDSCRFPVRDRNITLPESYVEKLEAQVRQLKSQVASSSASEVVLADTPNESTCAREEPHHGPDPHVPNPLLEVQHGLLAEHVSSFTGEAACTAFGDRLLQCVDKTYSSISCSTMPDHVTHTAFNRLLCKDFQFPNRIQASLLIRRVDRFIGNNYELFLKKSFFERFDRAYNSDEPPDLLWACHLFALLALGELYSSYTTTPNGTSVPGTSYFVQAVSLLQDTYESPSVEQVQILLLLSFYANSIGRLKSAHVYCGIALRLSIGLGLHRSRPRSNAVSPVLHEYRNRLFWTLYLFDRLISSKLGYPLAIRDEDIDVEMPSMDGLSVGQREEFHNPVHLCAHIKLAKITGDILSDVYCLPHRSKNTFVRRVHRMLNNLRDWDTHLPATLRLQSHDSARNLYTLHMHYHLCIIQTTRPILLFIFKTKLQHPPRETQQKFSPTTMALAEACTQAARTTNQLLSRLFIEGSLAMFGYFDAHYLFSSTLILIISAVMEPAAAISDAVQMAFSLLRTMATNGNVSAKDYLSRLEHVRASVSSSRGDSERKKVVPAAMTDPNASLLGLGGTTQSNSAPDIANDWALSENLSLGDGFSADDPLGNPFIENFLDERAFEWPSGLSPQEDALRQFAYELGDEFVFGT